jgi:hypothetical protein
MCSGRGSEHQSGGDVGSARCPSGERLRIEVLDLRQAISVEGRLLVHGRDEQTGRNYLMLKGTDAKIHFIQYTPEMDEARSRGDLKTNSFVGLRKLSPANARRCVSPIWATRRDY